MSTHSIVFLTKYCETTKTTSSICTLYYTVNGCIMQYRRYKTNETKWNNTHHLLRNIELHNRSEVMVLFQISHAQETVRENNCILLSWFSEAAKCLRNICSHV